MTRKIGLLVNDMPVETDYFVQGFIDHTISGMMEALEGTGPINNLELSVDGERVTVNLNDRLIPTNPFVSKIIRNTVTGMVSSLKGVGEVNRLVLYLRRDA
ncbi:MAG: hypothetical protein V1780_04630 [Chloroflexota bacterium]